MISLWCDLVLCTDTCSVYQFTQTFVKSVISTFSPKFGSGTGFVSCFPNPWAPLGQFLLLVEDLPSHLVEQLPPSLSGPALACEICAHTKSRRLLLWSQEERAHLWSICENYVKAYCMTHNVWCSCKVTLNIGIVAMRCCSRLGSQVLQWLFASCTWKSHSSDKYPHSTFIQIVLEGCGKCASCSKGKARSGCFSLWSRLSYHA